MYSYGNYYSWHAAIADTTHYNSGDHGTTSLCPTGWRLPISGVSTASNSYGALSVALGGPEGGYSAHSSSTPTGTVMSKIFRSYPNNFLYSGSFVITTASERGVDGRYWSSTTARGNESNSLYLYLGVSAVELYATQTKYDGQSIRCTLLAGT